MECYTNEHGFLEELLLETLSNNNNHHDEMERYENHQDFINNNTSYDDCVTSNTFVTNTYPSFDDYYALPVIDQSLVHSELSTTNTTTTQFPNYYGQFEDYYSMSSFLDHNHQDNEDGGLGHEFGNVQSLDVECKVENNNNVHVPESMPSFDMGFYPNESEMEKKATKKKTNGQPSKNLMAERRRRKRLNDRLSMLRSVVPKISKMDRTSILGDTIDYMKELLERINNLQEEIDLGTNQLSFMTILNDVLKPKDISVRNSPKFDVERRDTDTKIEIGCGTKPGLLLSTVTTIEEALGLEIQHCVISCFSDFAMQASCCTSQELKQRDILDSEGIKQALIRNAGYGGRCL